MKTLLINDTSKTNHFGCKILNIHLNMIFKKKKINITKRCFNAESYEISLKKIRNENFDYVIINGEGTLHHDQKELINILNISKIFFDKKIPVYLINATIQKISYKYIKIFHKFKKIYVRENLSKIFLNKFGIRSKVVPDLIFYKKVTNTIYKNNNNILITDSTIVRDTKRLFDLYNQFKKEAIFVPLFYFSSRERNKFITKLKFYIYRMINIFFPKQLNVYSIFTVVNYNNLIKLLISSNYLISGRFHMIALSLIYRVPFSYTSSNTYKIEGLLKDIGINGRKLNLSSNYKLNFKKFTKSESKSIKNYLYKAPIKIDEMFQEIVNDKK
jgi:hypothetical protein